MKARRPHDRADLTPAQVERQARRRGRTCGLEALGRPHVHIQRPLARPGIEGLEQSLHLEIGECELIAQAAREERTAIAYRGKATHDLDSRSLQYVQVQRRVLGRTHELRRGKPARTLEIIDLVVTLTPHARVLHPPE